MPPTLAGDWKVFLQALDEQNAAIAKARDQMRAVEAALSSQARP